jgi:hypothetical protein
MAAEEYRKRARHLCASIGEGLRDSTLVQTVVQIPGERLRHTRNKPLFRNILRQSIEVACKPLTTKALEQNKTTLKNELVPQPPVSLDSRHNPFQSQHNSQFV